MSNFEALKSIGAEVKRDKNNQLIIGFTSQKITNEQLNLLSGVNEDCLLAFYSCDFSSCDLCLLKTSSFRKIAVIYCRFDNDQLCDICEIPSLNWLKIFDTKVTNEAVEKILMKKNNLQIKLN
ncbi:hypothetical protein [Marinimicrobium locisalis]|uniref:hypothetical protein n=1 Tax=Marinimicrobium locisalis TaxID=546022 RepID=UPI003221B225